MDDLNSAIFKALSDYIKTNCPSICDVRENWPNPNEKLKMPCVTIFWGNPNFIPMPPENVWQGETGEDGKASVSYKVGEYEFQLQADIWCSSKPERRRVFEEFSNALALQSDHSGVHLSLSNYFDQTIHVSLGQLTFVDDEAGSQRNEWRIKSTLVVDANKIVARSEQIIETVETHLGVTESNIEDYSGDEEVSIIAEP